MIYVGLISGLWLVVGIAARPCLSLLRWYFVCLYMCIVYLLIVYRFYYYLFVVCGVDWLGWLVDDFIDAMC